MFKSFYRSLVVSQTARAAAQTLRLLSAKQMVALNINPETFVAEQIAAIQAEFAAADRVQAQKSARVTAMQTAAQTVNPNLAGAV
jgi:LAS superfamily LD-carboxypeptidase LdcB